MMKRMIWLVKFELVNKQLKQLCKNAKKKKMRSKSGAKLVDLFTPIRRQSRSFISENMLISQRQWIGSANVRK